MKFRALAVCLFLLLVVSAKPAEALCAGDAWLEGYTDYSFPNGQSGTLVRVVAGGRIGHSSTHDSSCYGELYVKVMLAGFAANCENTASQLVTHTSTHTKEVVANCTGTPGHCYGANGNQWWNGDDIPAAGWMASDCDFLVKRDEDSDGWSPDDTVPDFDCDDGDDTINPGYVPTCDIGSGEDRNCDGVDDLSQCNSPVVIDVAGNGIRLTNAAGGVWFDLNADGLTEPLSWTSEGADDAWLTLDRNNNNKVDDGTELFGNFTPQPVSDDPNGFEALATFDENSDRWIDRKDSVFGRLRLWTDLNHDGISQGRELRGLSEVGVKRISVDYKESARRDRYGNRFRFKAQVRDDKDRDIGKFAWDVYLVTLSTSGNQASVVPAGVARQKPSRK